ncbi:MAG TPA: hypothetical protein VKV26_16950 [Dehalococcoidia bacterium]|nr:hypothetical protein [Dehalococcoidia bacterium]
MIVERLTFRAKFGQGDTVVAAFKHFNAELAPQNGLAPARILVDSSGAMFTVVVEQTYEDLATFVSLRGREEAMYGSDAFQQWFAAWSGAVESGERQLFTVVD